MGSVHDGRSSPGRATRSMSWVASARSAVALVRRRDLQRPVERQPDAVRPAPSASARAGGRRPWPPFSCGPDVRDREVRHGRPTSGRARPPRLRSGYVLLRSATRASARSSKPATVSKASPTRADVVEVRRGAIAVSSTRRPPSGRQRVGRPFVADDRVPPPVRSSAVTTVAGRTSRSRADEAPLEPVEALAPPSGGPSRRSGRCPSALARGVGSG